MIAKLYRLEPSNKFDIQLNVANCCGNTSSAIS